MSRGEFLTRLTIWLALIAYACAAGTLLMARQRTRWRSFARSLWTFGCALFLAHVVCAFAYYHDWSHATAYRETARQTGEMTGVRWGGGLFLNYLLGAAWLVDVLCWWHDPERLERRPLWLTRIWHAFFFFMVFNGTVVFGKGPVRWLGALICVGLAGLWCYRRQREVAAASPRR